MAETEAKKCKHSEAKCQADKAHPKGEDGIAFYPLASTDGEEGDEERCRVGLFSVGQAGV